MGDKKSAVVIGSGISGLSSSLFLSSKFDVNLLEKNSYLGGHTRTKSIIYNSKNINIDTGFIVYNEQNYSDLTKFFDYLEVKSLTSDMSFSVSLDNHQLEYGGSNLKSIFSQKKNIFSIKFIKMLFEIRKLYNNLNKINLNEVSDSLTIEEYLNINQYSTNIREFHIYPMISSIWSSNANDVKCFPLISFINFFKNHGLFKFNNRPIWKFVSGGSNNYIKNLLKKKLFKYEINTTVKKIIREKNKIRILTNKGEIISDIVVIATHADQALSMLHNPSEKEYDILSKFKYTSNKAFLHSDEKLMPYSKSAWSSWNFLGNTRNYKSFSLSYWMNKLQNIKTNKNFFVTINPSMEPNEVFDTTIFEHPLFNLKTLMAQKKLSDIQGEFNTYYCGSYCGYGFHEDGIQSAAYIANLLNIDLPWKRDKNFENRLYYN